MIVRIQNQQARHHGFGSVDKFPDLQFGPGQTREVDVEILTKNFSGPAFDLLFDANRESGAAFKLLDAGEAPMTADELAARDLRVMREKETQVIERAEAAKTQVAREAQAAFDRKNHHGPTE